jgi:hypothetical protein
VCKGTDCSKLTILKIVGVGGAVFRFVFFGMVEIFDPIVSVDAVITVRTRPILCNQGTKLRCVVSRRATTVSLLAVVIVPTLLGVMLEVVSTSFGFESHQVDVKDLSAFSWISVVVRGLLKDLRS